MKSIDYTHIPRLPTTREVEGGHASLDRFSPIFETYDMINGRSYDRSRNPFARIPLGRILELLDELREGQMIVATDAALADRVVGVIGFRNDTPDSRMIDGLAVAETHQRRGIGRNLLVQAEDEARHSEMGSIALRSIPRAISFYERQGYQRADTRVHPLFIKQLDR